MDHKFKVDLVTANLSPKETYAQIIHSLQSLEAASADIFAGISARVESQRAALRAIDDRVTAVNAKIASLAGTKRAITVMSLPKYPAPEAGAVRRVEKESSRPTVILECRGPCPCFAPLVYVYVICRTFLNVNLSSYLCV